MRAIPNAHHLIEWIYTSDFPSRAVPLVILNEGKPGYVINQWVYYELQNGITPSLLEQQLGGLMQLYEFTIRKYGARPLTEVEAKNLVPEFLRAKRKGSIDHNGYDPLGLYWKPNHNYHTLKRYVKTIEAFDKWQATFHGATRLYPSEERFMNAYEVFSDFKRREKFDVLLHLFPSRRHTKEEFKLEHSRFRVGTKKLPKAFPLDRFIELVEKTPNPRDQMLWLLQGGGGLRQSETLHLYYEDVLGIDELGTPRIRLDDPETGEMEWGEANGRPRRGTRTEYLRECYRNEQFKDTEPRLCNLAPRTQGRRGRDHVGFKGMTFHEVPQSAMLPNGRQIRWHEVTWIDPRFAFRFWRAYQDYVHRYFYQNPVGWPHHPYLFIQLDKDNYGLPMTLAALRKAWHRALKRLRMEDSALGEHSLRHMYGYYGASVLRLPLEVLQCALHHANPISTQVYYHLDKHEVKKIILKAVAEQAGRDIADYLIMPGTPQPAFPPEWQKVRPLTEGVTHVK